MVCASAINKSCCPRPANYETDTSPTLCLCNGQIRRRLWSRVLNFVWDPSLGLHGSLQRKNQGFGDSLELRPMRFLSGPFDIAIVSCSSGTRPPISWTTERTGPATSFARLSLPLNQGLIHAWKFALRANSTYPRSQILQRNRALWGACCQTCSLWFVMSLWSYHWIFLHGPALSRNGETWCPNWTVRVGNELALRSLLAEVLPLPKLRSLVWGICSHINADNNHFVQTGKNCG